MVIHINPNRINTAPASGKSVARRQQQTEGGSETHTPPSRPELNHIPSPESLGTLIRSAVSALRRGIAWDRGTILNLLV